MVVFLQYNTWASIEYYLLDIISLNRSVANIYTYYIGVVASLSYYVLLIIIITKEVMTMSMVLYKPDISTKAVNLKENGNGFDNIDHYLVVI